MKKNRLTPVMLVLLATSSAYAVDPVPTPTPTTAPAMPSNPNTAQPATTLSTSAPSTVDCTLHIPASQANIEDELVTNWASKAVLQSFNFSSATIDNQLESLKACFTETGWKGFTDALQKSGNINSIKTQKLNVSSQAEGTSNIEDIKDKNQWRVNLPIQVTYQNDKEKVIQHLKVDVLIGRKPNGDLGIMQMIASTRPAESNSAPAPAAPAQNGENTEAAPEQNSTPVNPAPATAPAQ